MKRRVLSLLMALTMCLTLLPYSVLAAEAKTGVDGVASGKEIDSSTYEALGLSLDAEDKGASLTAPYSKEHVSQAFTASEIYTSVRGINGSKYMIRDGFDRMETNNRDSDIYDGNDKSNVKGNVDGAYARYGVSSSDLSSNNGNTYDSKLSSNNSNMRDYASSGFMGIYATSTAFDMGDGKDNYIAELRALAGMSIIGKSPKTTINGTSYNGQISVAVFRVDESGKRTSVGTMSPTANKEMTYDNGMAYLTRRYVQELDSIFEIAAADVDGDGKDEIFVYAGRWKDENGTRYAYVDVFNSKNAKIGQLKVDAGKSSSYQQSGDKMWVIEKIPIVTLAGGDFDRDGKEEIAVTVSASTDNSNVASAAHLTVFTGKSGSLKPIKGLNNVSLANGDVAMVSANCAFGTFWLPNAGVTGTVLLVAGYQSNDATSNHYSGAYETAAYRFAYYDTQAKEFKLSDYRTLSLGDSGKKIAGSYIDNPDKVYYRPVHAPIALSCADMEGVGADNNNDEVLLGGEIYDFDTTGGITTQLSSVSVCTSQVNDSNNNKDKEQVWISDAQSGAVDTNPSGKSAVGKENRWRESFVYVVGVHRKEKVGGDDDYYWLDLGAAYLTGNKGTAQNSGTGDSQNIFYSTQEGAVAHSGKPSSFSGPYFSLALPDFDNDSVSMRYVADYTVYTNPEVYAVLQATPYFADLNETFDYIGNGGTSYGTSKSTGSTKTASFSQAVGVYHSLEVQAFAGGEYEVELSASYSYDYASSTEVEHSVTYNAQAGGGDMVVVYTVPYQYYIYEMYDPDTKQWGITILPAALDPTVAVLDVEIYDEIAEETEGLTPISGILLYSTPGEPETYVNQPAGTRAFTFDGDYAHIGATSSKADITQEITQTTGEEHSHAFNLELNYKVGGGGALFGNKGYVGVTGSTGAGGGWSKTSAEGTAFSGTVDTLPAEATQYGFDWKLIVNSAMLGETPVWIVGYEVKNVVQPPRMPQNLTVTEVGTNTVDLEWEQSSGAAYYEISIIDQLGEYNKIATVSYTETQYQVTGLDPNTAYKFSVRAVSEKKGISIDSPIAYATTLNGNANFEITQQPQDTSTAVGRVASFTVAADYTDDSGKRTASYQWQVKSTEKKAGWTNLKGENGATLTVTATEDMDGYEYRCRVYVMNRSLYTKSAVLEVSQVPTDIGISMKDGEVLLSGNDSNAIDSKYTIAASVSDNGKKPDGMTGTVTFNISGTGIKGETYTVNLNDDGSKMNAVLSNFAPKGEGMATITATYSGDNVYAPSTESVNVYFVLNTQSRSVLSLNVPANVTYGKTASVAATLIMQADSGTKKDIAPDYTVEKLVGDKYEKATAGEDYTLSNGVFTPKLVTSYLITAVYTQNGEKLTDSKAIIVDRGIATLSATDTSKAQNDADRSVNDAVLSGVAPWENVSLKEGTDYTLTSEGITAALLGEYPIYLALKSSATVKALEKKYILQLKNAVYTLLASSYTVSAQGDTNGTVSVTYKADAASATLPFAGGSKLPAGSKVMFIAQPKAGYSVSRWKVGDAYLKNADNTFYSDTVYTVDSLDTDTIIFVSFTASSSKLTYSSNDTSMGTVSANYITDGKLGEAFSSGSNVNYSQSVHVSAQPKEGYSVDYWTVNGEIIKTDDGAYNYTGSTYTFDKLNSATEVTVHFIKDSCPTLTIKPVDNDGAPLVGAKVSVSGTELAGSNGVFTYTAHIGENLFITVTLPSGLLVDSWSAEAGKTGALSTDNRTMTLVDMREDTVFTVKCTALNRYTVSFKGETEDGSPITSEIGSVSAAKLGNGALTNGESVLQGSTIRFAADAKDGYAVIGWRLNGNTIASTADGIYQISSLSGNVEMVAVFRKQIKITLSAGENGTLTCEGHTSNSFNLPYGSKDALTFTAKPNDNYLVFGWTVNGKAVSGTAVKNSDAQTYTYTPDTQSGITADVTVAVTFTAYNWGEPTYEWSEDGKACTATRILENDKTHVETTEATVTGKVTKAATCTDKGETTYTATFAADWATTQTKVIADITAKGHKLSKTDAKAATHMTEGNIEYWYCSVCEKYFGDEAATKEIALENTVTAKLADHTADTSKWEYDKLNHWNLCECGEKLNVSEHTFEWVTDKKATESEAGAKHEECTVCHAKRNENTEIPKIPTKCEKFKAWVVDIYKKIIKWFTDVINAIC